jgi:large subunit ribosomal protein L9
MKIILTARVSGLGKVGDIVEVKNGYAKNFLIPMKRAICMTKNNQKLFEAQKDQYEKANDSSLKTAEDAKNKLLAKNIVIIENASDDGRLYGSVSVSVIAEKINEALGDKIVEKTDVILAKPIKNIGVYSVKIDLHSDLVFAVKLVVSRSESEVEALVKADEKAKKDALAAQNQKEEKVKKEEVQVQDVPAEEKAEEK